MLGHSPLSVNPISAHSATSSQSIVITAGAGTCSITGNAAVTNTSRSIIAASGSYSITGNNSNILLGRNIVAGAGSYAITGNVANILRNYNIIAANGSYAITGNVTSITTGGNTIVVASAGSYSITGNASNILRGFNISTGSGSYSLTGNASNIFSSHLISAGAGVYSITGNAAFASLGRVIAATAGNYVITGNPATIAKAVSITASPGSYILTGNSTNIFYSQHPVITAGSGSYVITGNATAIRKAFRITASSGSYAITFWEVNVLYPIPEVFYLNLIVDLLPNQASTNYQRFTERLTVDSQVLDVRRWEFEESPNALAGSLNITLADVNQRGLITKDSNITFEIGRRNNDTDAWTYSTLLSTGYLSKSDYQLTRQGIGQADSFTFTALSEMTSRLNKVPSNNLILYNPARHTVTADDFEGIYLADGSYIPPIIRPFNGSVNSLFHIVFVEYCGFRRVKTNIPDDFNLGIVQFNAGEPYVNPINSTIGMFRPDYTTRDLGLGIELWVRDGTSGLPFGFPTPRQVTTDHSSAMGVAAEHKQLDALTIEVAQERYTFDYYTDRVENTSETVGDLPPFPELYVEIEIETTYRDYFRNSHPTKPVKTETKHILRTSRQNGITTIERTNEDFTYDSMGRVTKRVKETENLIPDPSDSFNYNLIDTEEEQETFVYRPHPYEPRQYYIAERHMNCAGLIFTDGDNQQLGRDYSRAAVQANLSGNVVDTMTSSWSKVSSHTEIITPQRNRKVKIQTTRCDYLTEPSGYADYVEDIRDGEVGVNVFTVEQQKITLYAEGVTEITKGSETINMGELKQATAIALGNRILKNSSSLPNIVNHTVIGLDDTLQKGSPINSLGRASEDLGVYVIEGRSMTCEMQDEKPVYFMNLQARETDS